MTVPVVQEGERIATMKTSDENGGPRMQFVPPAKFRSRNPPQPMDPRVRIMTIPEQTIAVLRFSGSGSDFPQRESELLFRLGGQCWRPVGATLSPPDEARAAAWHGLLLVDRPRRWRDG
jgi:SOUL heme-binding protein